MFEVRGLMFDARPIRATNLEHQTSNFKLTYSYYLKASTSPFHT